MEEADGITVLLKTKLSAAVSSTQLLKDQDLFLSRAYAIPYYIYLLINLIMLPLLFRYRY